MGASNNAGELFMTTTLVMGPKRPTRQAWRGSRPLNGGPREGAPGPDDPNRVELDEDGTRQGWMDPPRPTPEDDLALARMLGIAFLVGIACLVGLVVLLV
jgi:hypothetical protein